MGQEDPAQVGKGVEFAAIYWSLVRQEVVVDLGGLVI